MKKIILSSTIPITTALIITILTFISINSNLLNNFSRIDNTSAQTTETITINANAKVSDFTDDHRGVGMLTWEHDGQGKYAGQIQGLAESFKAAGVGIIRYAGGNYIHGTYFDRNLQDWTGQIGPIYSGTYNRGFAVNELASLYDLAVRSDAEVMIQANLTVNNPAMWTDLVRLAKERGWNSRFKYYELSNENDCDAKSVTSTIWWQRARDYSKMMKAVDTSIQIIGPAPCAPSEHWDSDSNNVFFPSISNYINPNFAIQRAGLSVNDLSAISGVTWHWYQYALGGSERMQLDYFKKYAAPGYSRGGRDFAEEFPKYLRQNALNGSFSYMKQGVTEVNIDSTYHYRPYSGSYMTSLWFTDRLPALAVGGVDFTTLYAGYGFDNAYAITYPGSPHVKLRPTYYSLVMLKHFFGDAIVSTTYTDKENLGVWGARSSTDPNKLYLMMTNFTATPRTVSINVQNFSPQSALSYTMRNTNPTVFDEAECGSWINGSMGETRKCIAEPGANDTQFVTSINNRVLRGAIAGTTPLASQISQIAGVPVNITGNTLNYTIEPFTATSIVMGTQSAQPVASAVTASPTTTQAPPTPNQTTPANPTQPPVGGVISGGIQVSGNKIVDTQGRQIKLVGVNNSGMEYACTGSTGTNGYGFHDGNFTLNQQTIDIYKSWKINAVRITLNETCWLGINGVTQQYSGLTYRNEVQKYVNLLNQNGMIAILDSQWNIGNPHIALKLAPMPNRDNSLNFWLSVNQVFQGNNLVIYDLHNEAFPNNNDSSNKTETWQCWRDAVNCTGMQSQDGKSFTPIGFQELVTRLRQAGATQIILLSGVNYSLRLDRWLEFKPVDPQNNLAAAWHAYDVHKTTYFPNDWPAIQKAVETVNKTVPVIGGEIGSTDGSSWFAIETMRWLDAQGIGYLAWTWNNWGKGEALLSDYNGTPTAYGQAVKNHFLSLNSSPITTASPSSSSQPKTPDINKDGEVNSIDFGYIWRFLQ